MRTTLIICLLALFTLCSFAQSSAELDSLTKIRNGLLVKQSEIQKEIDMLESQIDLLKSELMLPEDGEPLCETYTKTDAKVKAKPSPMGELLGTIKKKKPVTVYDYEGGYWLISYGNLNGYTSDLYLNIQPEMEAYLLAIESKKKIEDEESRKRVAEKQAHKLDKFDEATASKIRAHKYWIGMTTEMARLSRGNPDDINRSVGSWGTHEQWVYDNLYLYFEDGKLTNWQE